MDATATAVGDRSLTGSLRAGVRWWVRAETAYTAGVKSCGTDRVHGRELFMVSLASPSDLPLQGLVNAEHFACLVVWDARSAALSEIDRLLTPLLRQGASYLMFWGPGCARIHDLADETLAELEAELVLPDGATPRLPDGATERR